MPKDPKKYLYDITERIGFIFSCHLNGIDSLDDYKANRTVQSAVERELISIGEAVYNLFRAGIILPYADKSINRRNTLAH